MLGIAGCGDNAARSDAAFDTTFTYHATVGWDPMLLPQVTSVAVDGATIGPSGYQIDESYPSRDVALLQFAPRTVVVVTTTNTLTFKLAIDPCFTHPDGTVIREEEQFGVEPSMLMPMQILFFADCGSCWIGPPINVVDAWCS